MADMRKLYHLIAGLILVFIAAFLEKDYRIFLILSLFFLAVFIEVIRLLLPDANRLFCGYFGSMLRENEKNRPTGTVYYLGGILLSFLLFEGDIALFALTILAVGDTAASIIGKRWGRHRIRRKTLEGSMAFFIASIGAGLILYRLWPALPVEVLITGAVAGTLAELIPVNINDNFIIPLAASGAMQAISFFAT